MLTLSSLYFLDIPWFELTEYALILPFYLLLIFEGSNVYLGPLLELEAKRGLTVEKAETFIAP